MGNTPLFRGAPVNTESLDVALDTVRSLADLERVLTAFSQYDDSKRLYTNNDHLPGGCYDTGKRNRKCHWRLRSPEDDSQECKRMDDVLVCQVSRIRAAMRYMHTPEKMQSFLKSTIERIRQLQRDTMDTSGRLLRAQPLPWAHRIANAVPLPAPGNGYLVSRLRKKTIKPSEGGGGRTQVYVFTPRFQVHDSIINSLEPLEVEEQSHIAAMQAMLLGQSPAPADDVIVLGARRCGGTGRATGAMVVVTESKQQPACPWVWLWAPDLQQEPTLPLVAPPSPSDLPLASPSDHWSRIEKASETYGLFLRDMTWLRSADVEWVRAYGADPEPVGIPDPHVRAWSRFKARYPVPVLPVCKHIAARATLVLLRVGPLTEWWLWEAVRPAAGVDPTERIQELIMRCRAQRLLHDLSDTGQPAEPEDSGCSFCQNLGTPERGFGLKLLCCKQSCCVDCFRKRTPCCTRQFRMYKQLRAWRALFPRDNGTEQYENDTGPQFSDECGQLGLQLPEEMARWIKKVPVSHTQEFSDLVPDDSSLKKMELWWTLCFTRWFVSNRTRERLELNALLWHTIEGVHQDAFAYTRVLCSLLGAAVHKSRPTPFLTGCSADESRRRRSSTGVRNRNSPLPPLPPVEPSMLSSGSHHSSASSSSGRPSSGRPSSSSTRTTQDDDKASDASSVLGTEGARAMLMVPAQFYGDGFWAPELARFVFPLQGQDVNSSWSDPERDRLRTLMRMDECHGRQDAVSLPESWNELPTELVFRVQDFGWMHLEVTGDLETDRAQRRRFRTQFRQSEWNVNHILLNVREGAGAADVHGGLQRALRLVLSAGVSTLKIDSAEGSHPEVTGAEEARPSLFADVTVFLDVLTVDCHTTELGKYAWQQIVHFAAYRASRLRLVDHGPPVCLTRLGLPPTTTMPALTHAEITFRGQDAERITPLELLLQLAQPSLQFLSIEWEQCPVNVLVAKQAAALTPLLFRSPLRRGSGSLESIVWVLSTDIRTTEEVKQVLAFWMDMTMKPLACVSMDLRRTPPEFWTTERMKQIAQQMLPRKARLHLQLPIGRYVRERNGTLLSQASEP